MKLHYLFPLFLLFAACTNDEPPVEPVPPIEAADQTVYIVNEGQFQAGNASLSLYDPATGELQNDVFASVNERLLGDVFQSMTFFQDRAYLVINNSGKVEVVDPTTIESLGTIEGLTSPRFLLPLSASRAYVSDLYADGLAIVDPSEYAVVGDIPSGPWVQMPRFRHEQMVEADGVVFVTNYQQPYLYLIDPATDAFVDSIGLGLRAARLQTDAEGTLWVLARADYASDSPGALYRVDPATRQVLQALTFPAGEGPGEMAFNPTRDTLYYTAGDLFALPITATALPSEPVVRGVDGPFSGVGVDPANGDLYTSDVIDFVQRGLVFRFSASGQPLDTLRVGVGPMRFYFQN